MSILSLSIPKILDAEKFSIVANKRRGTYRLIYQRVDLCPNGAVGCRICDTAKGRIGFHPQKIEEIEVDHQRFVRNAWRSPNLIPNRWVTTDITMVVGGKDFPQGEGWDLDGRTIVWHESAPVKDQAYFGLRYRAYREDWVSVQHVDMKSFGGDLKAEYSRLLPFAELDQGQISVSIHREAAGFVMREGDRFIPPDAEMEFSTIIDARIGETQSRHQFVSKVIRAYGLDKSGTREIPIEGVTYRMDRQRFVLPDEPLPEKVVVVYRASPIYTVWRDQSEFRHQGSQEKPRVAILVREETAR